MINPPVTVPSLGSLPAEFSPGVIASVPDPPLHERLKYGSDLHGSILSKLSAITLNGEAHVARRASAWRKVDERLRLHIDLNESAKGGDGRPLRNGKKEMPFPRSIMIPVTYATLMSRMAMMFAIETQRDPLIHLEPVEGADIDGARLHEAVLKYDLRQSDAHSIIWQLLFDMERYGCCFLYDTWEEEHGWLHEQPLYDPIYQSLLPPHMQHLAASGRRWGLLREWSNWRPIAPDRMIIDGSQDLAGIQNHRFVGHWDMIPWFNLKVAERKDYGLGGPYFNLDAAKNHPRELRSDNTGREVQGEYTELDEATSPMGKVRRMQLRLIPKDWNLGSEERPERWFLDTWNNTVIIRAHRSVYHHEKATYSVGMADLDMHAPWTAGTGEQVEGSQKVINYFVAAAVVQQRKLMNDSMVYDPSMMDEERLLRPGPSRHIPLTKLGQRLLQKGMVRIPDMYSQLRFQDTTAASLQTVEYLSNWVQRLTGANDNTQGQLFETKHTLGEIEKAGGGSTARFGATLFLFEKRVIAEAAVRMIQNRQQFTSMDQIVEIAGELAKKAGMSRLRVRPEDLTGQYQYIPHTSTMPVDPARQAQMWGLLVQSIASNPQLLEEYNGKRLNPHALLEEWVQAMGVKYFDKFYETAQPQLPPPSATVVPDEAIARGAQAGRLAPLTREMLG